jgi:formyl-CoA transferase
MTAPPVNFADTPAEIRRMAPTLGQHSAEILREAGLSDAEIAAMAETGATAA